MGVVGAIAGGASAAVPAPMGRWWPAQTILSGFVNVTASEGNLGLGASPFGGFLLAGQGQASYCGPGGVAFSTPVAAPDDPVASGSPTFGPGGLGSLVGTQAGPGLHELNINDLDGVPPTFGNSSEVASGNTLNGVSDVTAAEGTSGDIAVAWLVNIPSQVLLTVRPARRVARRRSRHAPRRLSRRTGRRPRHCEPRCPPVGRGRWPGRHDRGRAQLERGKILLGTASCPLGCAVIARVFERHGAHRVQVAGRRITLSAGANRTLTAAIDRRGKPLLGGSGRVSITAHVVLSSKGTPPVRQSRTSRLQRG